MKEFTLHKYFQAVLLPCCCKINNQNHYVLQMTELLEITTDGNENKIEEESGGIGTRLKAILPWQGQFAPLVAELEQEAEN